MNSSEKIIQEVETDLREHEGMPTLTKKEMDAVSYVRTRRNRMDEKRSARESEWDIADIEYDAEVPDSPDGRAQVNLPTIRSMIQLYVGQQPPTPQIKLSSDGNVDGDRIEIQRMILDHFMQREKVWREIRNFRADKARYGTGILFTGLRFDVQNQTVDAGGDYFGKNAKLEPRKVRHIGIKNRDIRQARFDETAIKYEDAMDCILMESISIEEFKTRYKGQKGFKYINNVGTYFSAEGFSLSANTIGQTVRNVELWHYFNKITSKYVLIANRTIPIYLGTYTPKHGKLPVVAVQHYEDTKNLYGIGIPKQYRTFKPYIDQLLQTTIDGARLNSSSAILTSGDLEDDGDFYLESGTVQTRKMAQDNLANFGTYQPTINIAQNVEVARVMEDLGYSHLGLNIKSPFQSPAKTAFEAGLMREEQNIMNRPVSQLENYGMEEAFTMMLCNIAQFAPYQLANYLSNEDIEDFERYKIRVDNKKIKKSKNSYQITDEEGAISWMELTPEMMLDAFGMKVKISTPSTLTMKAIDREQFPQMLANLAQIAQLFPGANIGDPEDIIAKFNYLNDVEVGLFSVKSKRRRIAEENAMAEKEIADLSASASFIPELTNVSENPQQTQGQQGQNPQIPGF